LVPPQPAPWLIGDGAGKPAFVEKDVEVVLPESLAVPDAEEILDFAGLAGLFAVLGDLRRDLAGDLAGNLAGGNLVPSVLGFFDELWMERQTHEEEGLVTCISDTS
jgi:hypothetical protein